MSGPVRIGQNGNWATKSRVLQNTCRSKNPDLASRSMRLRCEPLVGDPSAYRGVSRPSTVKGLIYLQDGMVGSRNGHELRAQTSIAANEHYSGVVGAQQVLSCLSHRQPLDGRKLSNGLEGRPGVAAARINETADNP
ncbi:hypothetical protein FVEG_00765 [Fusarium verticillioides 7600]|uniref:Uncharacterized protein n=1 Tax=Gibberella moniliformis (strain M3125 / FGSC 7600) TaxID=334819 RepID=W7LNC6_GIBM7|nr:hypothetical protein FVEG_00765 [Fusarium verticillioides 7600]EWG36919.1 hypothetical protein FVEG_00765 [Fusarium verticillioides 7600]